MQFTSLALLALSALAIAAPSPVPANAAVSSTTQSVEMDSAIYSRLEKAFQDAAVGKQTSTVSARAGSDVRNDVINGQCNDIILIFARGTYGSGNIGTGIGVAFADNLIAQRPGKVAVQGVQPYAALISGYLAGGDEEGANSMASLTAKAVSQCPNSKIIWGGYSQGAQVTHKAAARISTSLHSKIYAIALFGDPNDGQAFPGALNGKVRTWCHSNDPICDGIPLPIDGHLTYEADAPAAAAWAASRV
ncbi:cutinase-domain-containing protein [Pyronema domesticum]|uniref:Cutinase n=1 Tax=Pyronema omphalodes (strain CBS 100304) TaxID=1076935 RepID=U4L062_PYROM|nr:cutinase-domain-containing protein [Pyronema domesticum]CCX07914.1 Similar to Cutinase; acc. no. Q9Y7G8 [Pyronema omphalodes CBS 100304]